MSHQGRNGQDGGPARQARRQRRLDAGDRGMARGSRRVPRRRTPAGPATRRIARADSRQAPPRPRPLGRDLVARPALPSTGPRSDRWPAAARRGRRQVLEPDVQVVRFQGPPGLTVEVLAPAPIPVPVGDGGGIITVGLKRGVGYRLRVTRIVERPLAELYPVIEVVGHLHRPEGSTPANTRSASSSIRTTWTTSSIAAGW